MTHRDDFDISISNIDEPKYYSNYRKYPNKLNDLIPQTKIVYFQNLVNDNNSNDDKMWQIINRISNESSSNDNITTITNNSGVLIIVQ